MKNVTYAIKYAQKGLSVIPMHEKKPLIKFADQPPLTVEQIEAWWERYPQANIALKTDKFFVLDLDRHYDDSTKQIIDGVANFKTLHHDEWLAHTLGQRTAGGGYQYFFLKPENSNLTQFIGIVKGVDLKAHNNNYVMVPPSRVKGKPYQWINHKPLITAPDDLMQWIKAQFKKKNSTNENFNINYTPTEKTKTALLFETIINGLGDNGERNNNLTEFCGGLLFRHVNPEVVYQLAQLANQATPDSLPDKEVHRTVMSMIKKEERRRQSLGIH